MMSVLPAETVRSSSSKPHSTPRCSIDELDAAICRLARRINAQSYQLLVLVREFDDRLGWAKWSCASCADWLAWRCGLSLSAAREHVRTAQALRSLPAISAAFAEGRLSYTKVRALTRVAHVHDEDLLLAYALQATAAQVEDRCRQIRNVGVESVEVAQRAWERRSLTVWRDEGRGTLRITADIPIEDGEIVVKALECAVQAGEAALGPEFAEAHDGIAEHVAKHVAGCGTPNEITDEDRRAANGWHAQQADALVAIAKSYLGRGAREPPTASSADHCQVVIHVDEKALRGGISVDNPALRADLPIETVRRLSCDGSIVTVVEDERGNPLDVGRKQRTVSTPLKRALWSRDRGCSFPACQHRHYVDAHHIKHWAEGGDTSLENLILLCSHHHRLLHEGGFKIRRDHEGEIYFARPDGRVIPRHGYRLADLTDDPAEDPAGDPVDDHPSPEVREAGGIYLV